MLMDGLYTDRVASVESTLPSHFCSAGIPCTLAQAALRGVAGLELTGSLHIRGGDGFRYGDRFRRLGPNPPSRTGLPEELGLSKPGSVRPVSGSAADSGRPADFGSWIAGCCP